MSRRLLRSVSLLVTLTSCASASSHPRHQETPAVEIARATQSLVGRYSGPGSIASAESPSASREAPREVVGEVDVRRGAHDGLDVELRSGFAMHCTLHASVTVDATTLSSDGACDAIPGAGTVALARISGHIRRESDGVVIEATAHRTESRGGVALDRWISLRFLGHPTFESSIGRFAVDLPGAPTSRTVTSDGVETTFFLLDVPSRGRTYALSYSDLASLPNTDTERTAALERARDSLVAAQSARVVATSAASVGDAPALDARLVVSDGRGELRLRLVLVAQRMFQLAVTGNYGEIFGNEEVERFIQSFRPLSAEDLRDQPP